MWKNGIKMRGTRRQSRRHPQQVTTAVMLLRLLLVMLLQTTTVTEASSSEGKVPQTTPIAKEMEEGRDNDHRYSVVEPIFKQELDHQFGRASKRGSSG